MMVGFAREGVRVGDMTLCKHCNRAIIMYRLWEVDGWFHMGRQTKDFHKGEPKAG